MAMEQLDRFKALVPPQIAAPAIIAILTAVTAVAFVYNSRESDVYEPKEKHTIKVEELWHYPIKGLMGVKLDTATIGPQGFEDDRTFCLAKIHRDENGKIAAWETMYSGFHLQMVLFQAMVENREKGPKNATITVTRLGPENPSPEQITWAGGKSEHQISLPLRPETSRLEKVAVPVIESAVDVYDMGADYSAFFTKYMGFETKLLYIGDSKRRVLGSFAPNGEVNIAKRSPLTASIRRFIPSMFKTPNETIVFQDFGQYLIVTKESNDQISSRLQDGLEMDIHKFRPNVIVSGAPAAYDEDYWSRLEFPRKLNMDFGGTCWRCQAITVDLKTGKKAEGEEGNVWKMLMADRRVDKGWKYGPVFGKYAYTNPKDIGREIKVGDKAVLTKRVRERPIFDWPLPKAAVAAFAF